MRPRTSPEGARMPSMPSMFFRKSSLLVKSTNGFVIRDRGGRRRLRRLAARG
jgi:hypothetical protein